jgi:hypothetical protein
MARGSKRQGENLQYFDCKLLLPKKGEQVNSANLGFSMKTRVETKNDNGTVQIVRTRELPPVEFWNGKEIKTSLSPIPTLRSNEWDYVANETYLSGTCVKVQTGSYEHNGEKIPTFKILLKDSKEKELYSLDFRFNIPVMSFLNSFVGLTWEDEDGPVRHDLGISVSSRKDKNQNERATLYLRSDSKYNDSDDLVSWRFVKNDSTNLWEDENGVALPEVIRTELPNGKIDYNNDAQKAFYVEELNRIGKILESLKVNDEGEVVDYDEELETNEPVPTNAGTETSATVEDDPDLTYDDDDLPF